MPARFTALAAPEAVVAALAGQGYIADRGLGTAVFLAARLGKPLLVEGPAGVGKTELARALAGWSDLPLLRLQCYEGLDEGKSLYEWQYGKQLLYTQILKDHVNAALGGAAGGLDGAMTRLHAVGERFYAAEFLAPRPLLQALQAPAGAVLLIDEIDKADPEFEAFLLEMLADFQVSIPELGRIAARVRPFVVLTSNAARDLGDALKRRCLHLHIGFPDAALEGRIVAARAPEAGPALRAALVAFVQGLRNLDLRKLPSVSETIDWARALVLLHTTVLGPETVRETLNVLLKYEVDVETAARALGGLMEEARRAAAIAG
ncbi:MAG: MoxR family ATPase [Rhodospirillales bacterium]|nr:MoxR family ATPase [Rhodospirillales bacterium]